MIAARLQISPDMKQELRPVDVHSGHCAMSDCSQHWFSYFLVNCVSSQYTLQDANCLWPLP